MAFTNFAQLALFFFLQIVQENAQAHVQLRQMRTAHHTTTPTSDNRIMNDFVPINKEKLFKSF